LKSAVSALFLALLSFGSIASAQRDPALQRAAARSLFAEGVEFARAGRWDEASDRFERAMELNPSPVIAYNVASALERVGRVVEAAEYLRQVRAFEDADPEVVAEAATLLGEIEPRIARLTLDVPPGVTVELDGAEMAAVELGVALPIDPGSHRIVVRSSSGEPREQTVELAPGEARRFEHRAERPARAPPPREVEATRASVAPATAVDPAIFADPPADDSTVFEEWWFWTAAGALLAGGALVLVFSLAGSSAAEPLQGDLDVPVLRGTVMP
jgi:tetratricopeptide (TPR) repeat protein